MKIWQRYFFFDTLKVLFFFLILFWGLYVLIDYTSHTGNFHHHKTPLTFLELTIFYTGELIRRSEVLLPFAILVGSTRVMTKLNTQNELIALLAAGIPLKRLLTPFIWVGLLGVATLYISEETLIPWSMENARLLGETPKPFLGDGASHVRLKGGSILIYQSLNKAENFFYDVWWISSIDEIWRFKTLSLEETPKGIQGEKFVRNLNGVLESKERFESKTFPEIVFNPKRLLETLTPPDEISLTELYRKLPTEPKTQKQARHLTAFYRKLFLPWLALFAVLIPAPLATRFRRGLNVFFIYVISLFSLFFIYVIFNVATILSERQLFAPLPALLTPFFLISAIMAIRWIRLK